MRIFLDTNVILENFLAREDFKTAHNLFRAMQGQNHELFMSVGSFYTMIFLVDKYLRKVVGLIGDERVKMLRQMMSNILQTVSVAEHDNESLLRGIKNDSFKDVEDGCQYELAMKAGCTLLLTFNSHDFPSDDIGSVKVLTPGEFLEQQENKISE
jgi:predicted nucleic acid-binding protein